MLFVNTDSHTKALEKSEAALYTSSLDTECTDAEKEKSRNRRKRRLSSDDDDELEATKQVGKKRSDSRSQRNDSRSQSRSSTTSVRPLPIPPGKKLETITSTLSCTVHNVFQALLYSEKSSKIACKL